jgi:hypothetical protein
MVRKRSWIAFIKARLSTGSLLFPHHALLRDEFRKVQLDEPHLLDRQRLAFCECTNARCFSGVVVDASNVRFPYKKLEVA